LATFELFNKKGHKVLAYALYEPHY